MSNTTNPGVHRNSSDLGGGMAPEILVAVTMDENHARLHCGRLFPGHSRVRAPSAGPRRTGSGFVCAGCSTMSRKIYETELFDRPNSLLGTELHLLSAKGIPEEGVLDRFGARPAWSGGGSGRSSGRPRVAHSLGEGTVAGVQDLPLGPVVAPVRPAVLLQRERGPSGVRLRDPVKSLASRGAKGVGMLSDVKREPPRFLEDGQHSFSPGWGMQPLMFREWGLFNPSSPPSDGKSRPKYVQMECERWLDFGNGQVSPYSETTLFLAVPGRDDESLLSGRVPGVLDNPKRHDWGNMVTSIPFLALGVLDSIGTRRSSPTRSFPLNPTTLRWSITR